MSTKTILVSVLLVSIGILFGVVLVSGLKGVGVTFAQAEVTLGSGQKPVEPHPMLKTMNEVYKAISDATTPSVVYITVRSQETEDRRGLEFFHRFFDPDTRIPRQGPSFGAGSGVLLTKDGYILTNNHVVEDAAEDGIRVRLLDTREYQAKLIGRDRYTDLAVIKIEADDLPTAFLGNSDEVEVGHVVFAFGNPLGLTSTMTQGIVSALGRQIRIIDDEDTGYGIENFIQTDAAVNPGNSGGALVDITGSVIGINTAIATTNARYQGYSFAIPINLARKVANDIIKYGTVRRGFIGVQIQNVDAVTAKAQGLDRARGVIVQGVTEGSAGEEAGLKLGDIILTVDGREVNTANALQSVVASRYPGETVTLKVFRNRKEIEKKVTLKLREEAETVASNDQSAPPSKGPGPVRSEKAEVEKLGMTVISLDKEAQRAYETDDGVLVENVERFGPASERGISRGDVILSVGDKTINRPEEFRIAVAALDPGDAVMLRVKRPDKRVYYIAVEIPQ